MPVWQTTFSIREKTSLTASLLQCYNEAAERVFRRACSVVTKQSSGFAFHGQACSPPYNEAVELVLTTVRRARSVTTKQSSGRAYHSQACAQCYNEAVEQVCSPWSAVLAVLWLLWPTKLITAIHQAEAKNPTSWVAQILGSLILIRKSVDHYKTGRHYHLAKELKIDFELQFSQLH